MANSTASNRTFFRIAANLPVEIAQLLGFEQVLADPLKDQLEQAVADQNWPLVERLSSELAQRDRKEDVG